MPKKKDGGSVIATRSGLDAEFMGYAEGLAYDPFGYVMVVRPPPADLKIEISYTHGDAPERLYTFGAKDVSGPNDRFEPGIGWDPTFRYAQQSDLTRRMFERQVVAFLNGSHPKPVLCHHEKDTPHPIIIDARTTVFALRVAGLIRRRLKEEPVKVQFRRRKYTEASAATATRVANITYERDAADKIEAMLYEMNVNGWSFDQAAKEFGKSAATIRAWVSRYGEVPRRQRKAKPHSDRSKPIGPRQLKAAEERAAEIKGPVGAAIAYTIQAMRTGKVPEGAPDEVRKAFEA